MLWYSITVRLPRHPLKWTLSLIQAALDDAVRGGRKAEAATWRRRMHCYLDALLWLDPAVAEDFHHYQARTALPPVILVCNAARARGRIFPKNQSPCTAVMRLSSASTSMLKRLGS